MPSSDDAPFSRPLPLRAASLDGGRFDARATADEGSAVARLLDVVAVESLRIAGEVAPIDGMFRLHGRVEAAVVQSCVVTFEPVRTELRVSFERHVVVGSLEDEGTEVEVMADETDVDYVPEAEIDLGAIAVEEMALALPDYPRAPDAEAVLADAQDDAAPTSPFAVLARRRGAS